MIYCSTFAKMGRLGNHIMRLMTMIGFSKKYNTPYFIPEWEYAKYFSSEIPQKTIRPQVTVREQKFYFTPEYWNRVGFKNRVIDIYGWFQSWRYWEPYKKEISETLKFKDEFIFDLYSKYLLNASLRTIAISVRRGDFVDNPNYYQLPLNYYLGALEKHFPDYKSRTIFIFSDDLEWCRKNFKGDNFVFVNGTDIEQLALMTLCDNYIISNSTFSYCGAYLSRNENAKVIRPKFNFAGPLANRKSEKDYWPEGWIIYDYEPVFKSVVLVYHKNISKVYPKEWIMKFRQSILSQTHKNFDILELNYGGTGEKIFPTSKFESKEFKTFAYAMNYLLDKCGEYDCVFNTNVDDWFSPTRFERQIKYIKEGYDIVSSNFSLVKNDKITLTHRFEQRNIKNELEKNHNVICHPVIAYSKKFVQSERYNPEEIPFEDMNLWKRTVGKYKFIILPDVLCYHRLHEQSVGHNLKEIA